MSANSSDIILRLIVCLRDDLDSPSPGRGEALSKAWDVFWVEFEETVRKSFSAARAAMGIRESAALKNDRWLDFKSWHMEWLLRPRKSHNPLEKMDLAAMGLQGEAEDAGLGIAAGGEEGSHGMSPEGGRHLATLLAAKLKPALEKVDSSRLRIPLYDNIYQYARKSGCSVHAAVYSEAYYSTKDFYRDVGTKWRDGATDPPDGDGDGGNGGDQPEDSPFPALSPLWECIDALWNRKSKRLTASQLHDVFLLRIYPAFKDKEAMHARMAVLLARAELPIGSTRDLDGHTETEKGYKARFLSSFVGSLLSLPANTVDVYYGRALRRVTDCLKSKAQLSRC